MDKAVYTQLVEAYAKEIHNYGDMDYFAEASWDGFSHAAFGSGPWVFRRKTEQRVQGIFALYGINGWVRAIERFGRRNRVSEVIGGKQMHRYAAKRFERHLQRFKINMGLKVGLDDLLDCALESSPVPASELVLITPRKTEAPKFEIPLAVLEPENTPVKRVQVPFRPYGEQNGLRTYLGGQDSLGLL